MRPPIKTPPSAPDVTDSPATLPVVRISALLACAEYHERLANVHETNWRDKTESRPRAAQKHRLQMITHREWASKIKELAG